MTTLANKTTRLDLAVNQITTHRDVVNAVVANDLCIGCGVCAAVCPSRLLSMDWSAQGELVPENSGKCPPKCDLCLVVCPFTGDGPDQEQLAALRFGSVRDVQHRDDLGYFLECSVGHAADTRRSMDVALLEGRCEPCCTRCWNRGSLTG